LEGGGVGGGFGIDGVGLRAVGVWVAVAVVLASRWSGGGGLKRALGGGDVGVGSFAVCRVGTGEEVCEGLRKEGKESASGL
jgi:hypothetical protein